ISQKVQANQKISWIHFDVKKLGINKKLYSRLYEQFDKIHVVSQQAEQSLLDVFPEVTGKQEVVYNVVNQQLVRDQAREPINLTFEGVKIVTVGRLTREKGCDLAIETLAKLRVKGIDAQWYWIGDGNMRAQYELLIRKYNLSEHFHLLGAKENPYPYMKWADIYVQPSYHEGYCLTLAEAKVLLKPIITTNFSGAMEQIVDGETGTIVEADAQQLTDKIELLIGHPQIAKDYSHNLEQSNQQK
ncbi:MAG: glycosyltransferase, partial [Culicoidibacterales bacterium]